MKLLMLALLAAPSAASVTNEPQQRTFELTYIAEIDVPEGAERVHMWLPYPDRDDYQDIRLIGIKSPVPTKLYQEYTYRNSMLFLSTSAAALDDPKIRVEMSFRVSRREHRETEFIELEDPEGWVESSASKWLRPVPDDETVVARAEEVTGGKESVVDKARAIFDYTVDTVEYDPSEPCGGVDTTFIGLSRAVGIAARRQLGFAIPKESDEGAIDGYRCWSEFYVPGFGWVPVDPTQAGLEPEKRETFFGAHDANRVELTRGRDIVLNPKQSSGPLDYFIYPYAEIDGKPVDDVRRQFFYKDLDVVAE